VVQLPRRSRAIRAEAVLVPDLSGGEQTRSNVVALAIKKPKPDFRRAERADNKNDIGEGTREVPVLEAANALLIQNVSALDTNGSERGNPGHMLVGEHPTVELDVVHLIGTKNVTDWIVSVTGAFARNAAGAALQQYQMDPSLVSGLLATGTGKLVDKTLQSFAEPVLPVGTRSFTLSLSLRDPALLINVATATVTIPVRNAGEVVQKEVPTGPSTISFSPIPGQLEIDSNLAQRIFLFHYFLEPIEPEDLSPPLLLQGVQERFASAPPEIAATSEEERLIPLNSHFGLYDTLADNGFDARVIFTYDPEEDFPDDPAFDEDALVIAALNPLSGELEVLPSVHDKQENTVSADYDSFFGFWTIASLVTTPAGVCADPTADGQTTASDALFALRTSVGLRVCAACICDVNQNGTITAADALLILRFAVAQNPVPSCVEC
jgi:hypothetical protein